MTPLQQAAQELLDRWDSTYWKDQRATSEYVNALREALEAEQAQAVEPVAGLYHKDGMRRASFGQPDASDIKNGWKPLYLRPAPPATGERAELIAKYRRLAHAARLRGQSFTPAITKGELLALCDMLEADAKFKPDWVGYRQGVEDGKAEAQQVAVPAEDGWYGHKFKEVTRGIWRCNCGKQLTESENKCMNGTQNTLQSQPPTADAEDMQTHSGTYPGREAHALSTPEVASHEAQQVAVPAWTTTADKMPEPCMNVLACNGKKQPIRAMWVPAKTLEDASDGDFGEYDDATDQTYWPEGWYETNAYEETHWLVDGYVTHWMPLPAVPQGSKL